MVIFWLLYLFLLRGLRWARSARSGDRSLGAVGTDCLRLLLIDKGLHHRHDLLLVLVRLLCEFLLEVLGSIVRLFHHLFQVGKFAVDVGGDLTYGR